MKGKTKGKLSKIFVRVYHNKIDVKAQSGQQIEPENWNPKRSRVRDLADLPESFKINTTLDHLETHLRAEFRKISIESINKEWMDQSIKQFYEQASGKVQPKEVVNKGETLFEFIRKFIDNAPRRINYKTNSPPCYKQIREYERTFYYLQEFAKSKKRKLDFDDIDLDFYYDFVDFLQSTQIRTLKNGKIKKIPGLAKNTTGKKIQTLKIFLNAAVEQGIKVNPHFKSQRFVAMKEESESIYLSESEIKQIQDLDLSENKRLEKARDLFLVGCYTGLRYSDWDKITDNNLSDGFLELKQSKTGNPVVIPLHPVITEMIRKYDNKLPTVITNQKFNEYLKEVAKMAELTTEVTKTITIAGKKVTRKYEKWELVTTHTGRRSFATNLYKKGFPTLNIMQITGHRTESSFLKYIKVTPREHAEKLKQFWMDNPLMTVAK
ncbi:MAG: site-specific integrase [Bacteroidota bacterium]